jgi:FKBP-type peptidyl-prolyl cis-trans isomerase 2
MRPSARPARRHLPTSPFAREVVVPATTDGFSVGDRVTADKHGMGRVLQVTEDYVVVDFGSGEPYPILAGTERLSRL